ncbi:hypothetical protein F5Y16DRAFT_422217 [Xylariaceae sp. FL0255]|nr:hypothetical protein F5Y16DRAFT_422217 [Xylariaceae sp. FL0255]
MNFPTGGADAPVFVFGGLNSPNVITPKKEDSTVDRNNAVLRSVDKPIKWSRLALDGGLKTKLDSCVLPAGKMKTGSQLLKSLLEHQQQKFIPSAVKELFKEALPLEAQWDSYFNERNENSPFITLLERHAAKTVSAKTGGTSRAMDATTTTAVAQQIAFVEEFRRLKAIVDFKGAADRYPRSKTVWAEKYYSPMLELMAQGTPNAEIENVSDSSVNPKWIPTCKVEGCEVKIDYALLLFTTRVSTKRTSYFVSGLELPTLGISESPVQRILPMGIFVKVKSDGQTIEDAKNQLASWTASWFNRVAALPSRSPSSTPPKLPFMPILLVDGVSWDLYFAFNESSAYDICGPLTIGDTRTLTNAYSLLAVLRDIANWFSIDFATWAKACVEEVPSLYM